MAYVTLAQIQPYVKTRLTENTVPTDTQAEALITDVEGIINMHLDQMGFTVPPTDANVLLWLKAVARAGVLAEIETIIYTQTGANRSDRTNAWRKTFDDAIEQIRRSPSSLGGPTRIDYVMPDEDDNPIVDADTVIY